MSDEDDTERGRRRISPADRLMLESARRKSYVYPVVEVDDTEPRNSTAPWELIDREELTPREQEVVRRSKRKSSDPATVADLVKVAVRAVKAEDKERNAAAIDSAELTELRTAVHDLKRDSSAAKWVARGLLAAALTVFLYVADRMLTRVEHEGEANIEMQHLKTGYEELRQDVRYLRSLLTAPIKGYSP